MSHDPPTPESAAGSTANVPAAPGSAPVAPSPMDMPPASYAPAPPPPDEERGPDVRRLLNAVVRYRWMHAAALVLGMVGAAAAWVYIQPTYRAEGSLWVTQEGGGPGGGPGDVAPIAPGRLLETTAWVELLTSFAVLDTVTRSEKLYLEVEDPEVREFLFGDFSLADRFAPGDYTLEVSENGEEFILASRTRGVVQRGRPGEPVGQDIGFRWTPPAEALTPGSVVEFSVRPVIEAAIALRSSLAARTDQKGNFINVTLTGKDPGQITRVLTAVMQRHVDLAAKLKREKLDETLRILEAQLRLTEGQLAEAERSLEEFRVQTIRLPSDRSTPISPGLQETRDPVFNNYFELKMELEDTRRDRERLEAILAALPDSSVRVEELELIPVAASSTELRNTLGELVTARSQLRVLRDRYSDEYPPIQDLLRGIDTIEREVIPRLLRGLIEGLREREAQTQSLVDAAGEELAAIPPRTIEEGRLRRQVDIRENLYNTLRQRVETARLAAASSIPDVRVLDWPSVPTRPSSDKRIPIGAGLILGLLGLSVGASVLVDRLDSRIRYPDQVDEEMGLEILGSIPRVRAAAGKGAEENTKQVLEAFRELRMTLSFAYGSAGPLTVTITSPSQGEGKTFIATNLAVAFAEMGRRTLLIDGDTRRGDAHRLLGLKRTPGLTDYLADRSSGEIIQSAEYERLDFIGSGSRSVSTPELLASPRMAAFLGTLKRAYDVIIVDAPPLAAGGDGLLLSSLTGHLALVIRTGSTEKSLMQAKLDQLMRFPMRLLGAILNDVEARAGGRYYAYYLPGYEAGDEEAGAVEDAEETADRRALIAASGGEGSD